MCTGTRVMHKFGKKRVLVHVLCTKVVKSCTGTRAMHKFGKSVYWCNQEGIFWRYRNEYQSPARFPGRSCEQDRGL